MNIESELGNILIIVAYSAAAIPATLFTILYAANLRGVEKRTETWHLLIFTGVIGAISGEAALRRLTGAWEANALFFFVTMGLASIMLWQRLTLLYTGLLRPKHEARLARRRLVEKSQVD